MIITPYQCEKKIAEALDEGDQLTAIAYLLLSIDSRLAAAITAANDPYKGH